MGDMCFNCEKAEAELKTEKAKSYLKDTYEKQIAEYSQDNFKYQALMDQERKYTRAAQEAYTEERLKAEAAEKRVGELEKVVGHCRDAVIEGNGPLYGVSSKLIDEIEEALTPKPKGGGAWPNQV